MKKAVSIILILSLSIAMMPNVGLACGSKTVKSCCKRELNSSTAAKDCCTTNKNHTKDDCGGKCKCNSCHCAVSHFTSTIPFFVEFKNIDGNFFTDNYSLLYKETLLSAGFYSIWMPPNIG